MIGLEGLPPTESCAGYPAKSLNKLRTYLCQTGRGSNLNTADIRILVRSTLEKSKSAQRYSQLTYVNAGLIHACVVGVNHSHKE